jgi:hypothetical protein
MHDKNTTTKKRDNVSIPAHLHKLDPPFPGHPPQQQNPLACYPHQKPIIKER